jgi:hypothetical protein
MAEAIAVPTVMVVRQWAVSGIAGAGKEMLLLRGTVVTALVGGTVIAALRHGGGVSEGVLDEGRKGGEGG